MSLFDNRYPEAHNIVVGTISDAKTNYKYFHSVISIEDVNFKNGLRIPENENKNHLILSFDDIEHTTSDGSSATEEHIRQAILFARNHKDEMLFIHCHAGQCRSPAIALAIIADRMGTGREDHAVDALKVVRRWSTPNSLVIQIADKILGRDGKLIEAMKAQQNKLVMLGSQVNLIKNMSNPIKLIKG